MTRAVAVLVILGGLATGVATGAAGAAGTSATGVDHAAATFTGPITVGQVVDPLSAIAPNLSAHGYVEQEFFASGMAHAFHASSAPADGRWSVTPTTSAPYETRILVRRPSNPAKFSGTVVVEWLNETAGETDPDWDYFNPALMAAGDAYVGVTAQQLGVQGGTPLLGSGQTPSQTSYKGLVQTEPSRYGSLHHPGDQYALDMFAQIGLGLRSATSHVFGGLHPRHIVADGESQSAFYLTSFADALQPITGAYDGIFIHSRGGSGAPLTGSVSASATTAGALHIRTDLHVPVFMLETQTDMIELGYAPAQQPDTARIRTWEVAGTSHVDAYLLSGAATILHCSRPVNAGPQHTVAQAAFAAFVRWVVHGTPPPSPAPLRLTSASPPALVLDHLGNAEGGVRTPAVDVPVATLSGDAPPTTSPLCGLFGSTTAFSPAQLATLYGSKSAYLAKFTKDLDHAIAQGYVLAADRSQLLAQAHQVSIGTTTPSSPIAVG